MKIFHTPYAARHVFLFVAFACLVAGLIFGTVMPALMGVATDFGGPTHDGYLQIANMLAQGHGFRFEPGGPPVMHRPPLYPLMLVPVTFAPIEIQKILVVGINSILAGISATLLYKLAVRFYNKPAIGWVAIAIYLLSPWIWRLITLPHTALLQSTLYLGTCYCVIIMLFGGVSHRPLTPETFRKHAIAFGFLSGLLSLTHGIGFLIFAVTVLLLLAIAFLKHPNQLGTGTRIGSIVLAAVIGASMIAPWTLRNLQTFPITIPVTTGASFNYFMGDLYWDLGGHEVDENLKQRDNALIAGGVNVPASEAMQYWGVMDPAHEKILAENMKAHAIANPGSVLTKSLLSLGENFFPVIHQIACHKKHMVSCELETWYTSAHRYGLTIYYGLIFIFALVSVVKMRTPGLVTLSLVVMGGLHIGPFLPLGQWAPHGIYALSAMILIMVLAADGLVGGRIKNSST